MADERTYIKVHDGIPDHPKVDGLSDKAFRLLIETWCWCSRHLTDGRVPMATWNKRGTARARSELVKAGLVDLDAGHADMHDYLEHQRSAAQVAQRAEVKRQNGTLGNHKRWHLAKGKRDPECPHCIAPAIANGSLVRSQQPSQTDRKPSPEVEELLRNSQVETDRLINSGGDRPVSDHAGDKDPPPQSPPTSTNRPAERCERHAGLDDDPGPCRACGDARRARDAWDADRVRDERAARSTEAHQRAEARALLIASCDMCDAEGYVGRVPCTHDPEALKRAARGRALVDAARQRRKDHQPEETSP